MKNHLKHFKEWLGTDGLLHLLSCLSMTIAIGLFSPIWAAAIIAITVGIGKEFIWDKLLGKGDASWHDVIADLIGVTIGVAILLFNLIVTMLWNPHWV